MLLRVFLAMKDLEPRARIRNLLKNKDVLISRARTKRRVWKRLATESFDLIVVGQGLLPDPMAEAVATIRDLPDAPDLIAVLDNPGAETRSSLLAAGCLGVLDLKVADMTLEVELAALLERRQETSLQKLRLEQSDEEFRLGDFYSDSAPMRQLLSLAKRVSDSDTSILILGETGVGKGWLARAIHEEGPRAQGPFISVNLAAVPEGLLEGELFGHEEGAFTGAIRSHRGYFELAHGGTLFMDEVAELSPHLQAKLLHVLQERRIQRVGGEQEFEVDVRVMAATNRDLAEEMAEKRFRDDLYYRLSVVSLRVPALRERREDIHDLVDKYVLSFQNTLNRRIEFVEPEVLQRLLQYSWPGNVRELMNVIERAVLLSRDHRIRVGDLPESIARGGAGEEALGSRPLPLMDEARDSGNVLTRPLREVVDETVSAVERSYLVGMLHQTRGHVGAAAQQAGISMRSMYQKMRVYGLKKEDFKPWRRPFENPPN